MAALTELDAELTSMFRSISSKRRNGVLTVESGEVGYEIAFSNGRIVEARRSDRPAAVEICQRLEASGHPLESVLEKLFSANVTLKDLCRTLECDANVPSQDVRRAKHAYEYDVLHSLPNLGPARYEFHQQMVLAEPELSLNVSPGQLLLDLVEVQSDGTAFENALGDLRSQTKWLTAEGEPPPNATEAELRVWNLLLEGKTLGELALASLASEYDFRRILLSFFKSGKLRIGERSEATEERQKYISKERAAELTKKTGHTLRDTVIVNRDELTLDEEEVFDELIDEAARLLTRLEESDRPNDLDTIASVADLFPQFQQVGESEETVTSADPVDLSDSESAKADNFGNAVLVSPEALTSEVYSGEAELTSEVWSLRTAIARLQRMNLLVEDPAISSRVSAGIVLLFLVAVAFHLSTFFIHWIEEIQRFSSS